MPSDGLFESQIQSKVKNRVDLYFLSKKQRKKWASLNILSTILSTSNIDNYVDVKHRQKIDRLTSKFPQEKNWENRLDTIFNFFILLSNTRKVCQEKIRTESEAIFPAINKSLCQKIQEELLKRANIEQVIIK